MKYVVNGLVLIDGKVLLAKNVNLLDSAGQRAKAEGGLSDKEIEQRQLTKRVNDYWSLPGGGVEDGESLKQALDREMLEETGIKAKVGPLLFINEYQLEPGKFAGPNFIFKIENPEDFVGADFSAASHSFELSDIKFHKLDTSEDIRPNWLLEKLSKHPRNCGVQYISEG